MSGARIVAGLTDALAIARRDTSRRVLVTGGRDYADAAALYAVLDEEHAREPIGVLMQGGALGADQLARRWAVSRRVPTSTTMADWATHGKAAGPIRNQAMIDQGPDLVIAAPGGAGTADCVRRARAAAIPVREVGQDQGEGSA